MEFAPGIFDDLLLDMGQQLSWRQSDLCPCRNPISGAARPNCPNCAGKGVIWGAPVPAWTGVASQRVAREWAAFGMWESGDMVATIPEASPFYAAGENDRALMINSSEPFRIILTYTGTEVVPFPVVEVDRVFWLDPTTQAIVQPAEPPTVNADGMLTWPDGTPPMNVEYTIRGRKTPEFYLFKDFPQDRAHFNGLRLPRRVVLRRFDLFRV